MVLPKTEDILELATQKRMEKEARSGLPSISPEPEELKETGEFAESQYSLMSPQAALTSEEEKYIHEAAGELGLEVIGKKELKGKEHEIRALKWSLRARKGKAPGQIVGFYKKDGKTRPIIKSVAALNRKKIIKKPKKFKVVAPKQPKRLPKKKNQRNGKTMRRLRSIKGVKVFSFPDAVWGIKERKNN